MHVRICGMHLHVCAVVDSLKARRGRWSCAHCSLVVVVVAVVVGTQACSRRAPCRHGHSWRRCTPIVAVVAAAASCYCLLSPLPLYSPPPPPHPNLSADGKTYSNNCEAAQANMDVAYDGECKKSPLPPCPPELGEYQCLVNPCAATTCPMDTVPEADYCGGCSCRCTKPDTVCTEVYAPVCGTGG